MDLLNDTGMVAGHAPGMLADARELLVVVVKGTFRLPRDGDHATLCEEQVPLAAADVFSGDPGLSAPVYESDYAPIKPFCDVILNGTAYSPGGKAASQVGVGVKVGRVAKAFHVVGDRVWESAAGGVTPGLAAPFVSKPFSYDVAFGGADRSSEDASEHDAYMDNPCGVGFRKSYTVDSIAGTPAPNTEERKNPVLSPNGNYVPMSFGPLARAWPARVRYAGTYDAAWLEHAFPFLPSDFDTRYFQCAPEDQQTEHLRGGEIVTLVNLTPDGRREFQLPVLDVPFTFVRADGERITRTALIDTLYIDPDNEQFILTWRACLPLRSSMLEISQVIVGRKSRAWWRAYDSGKTYYPGLAAAAAGRAENAGITA